MGGWLDVYLGEDHLVGTGYHHTNQDRLNRDKPTHDQAFLYYMFRTPIRELSLKLVYGYARGQVDDETAHARPVNTMQSVRVRVQYLFPGG